MRTKLTKTQNWGRNPENINQDIYNSLRSHTRIKYVRNAKEHSLLISLKIGLKLTHLHHTVNRRWKLERKEGRSLLLG